MKNITSLQHPFVKHWVKLRSDSNYRHSQERVVIDGIKIVHEVSAHTQTLFYITTNEVLLPVHANPEEVVLVSEAVMQKISGAKSPEGLMAEVKMPPPASLHQKSRLIVLDGINDPGNMGTILRTALALGWEGAYLVEPCCDPFNDKALRSAKGATFRLPLAMGCWENVEKILAEDSWQLLGADLEGASPESIPSTKKRMLVLGNESHGLSPSAKAQCKPVSIPMSGSMESLNVSIAAGILMYVLNKGSA